MKSKSLIGYDLDGTICSKAPKRKKPFFKQTGAERKEYQMERSRHFENAKVLLRPLGEFVIITARKEKESSETLKWLEKNKIKPIITFFLDLSPKTRKNIIIFKAKIINNLKLKEYYDDDEKICRALAKICINTKINVINNEK